MDKLSKSRIQTFQQCRKKYYYRYIKELEKKTTPLALWLGSLVHQGLALYYSGSKMDVIEFIDSVFQEQKDNIESLETDKELEQKQTIIESMLMGYLARYPKEDDEYNIHSPEKHFTANIINPETGYPSLAHIFHGYIDALCEDEWGDTYIMEHKTASRFTKQSQKLVMDNQITFYINALEQLGYEIKGVVYNELKKPSIRQRKKESWGEYLERLNEEYSNKPDKYFNRLQVVRTREEREQGKQDLWDIHKAILQCGKHHRNHNWCGDTYFSCPYIDICTSQESSEIIHKFYQPRTGREEDSNE